MSQFGLELGELLERAHALGRHRMRLHVGIGVAGGEQDLVGQPLEGFVHALRRLAGGGEEFHAGAVGRSSCWRMIGQQRAADRLLRAEDRGGGIAGIAAARADHRADAEEHGDDRLRLRHRHLLAQPRQMAAGDMAGLVGEHADDLVWRLGSISAPAFTKMRRPSMTKALNDLSLIMRDLDVLLGETRGARIGCV